MSQRSVYLRDEAAKCEAHAMSKQHLKRKLSFAGLPPNTSYGPYSSKADNSRKATPEPKPGTGNINRKMFCFDRCRVGSIS